jgi:mannose-6-phosphate isomerase
LAAARAFDPRALTFAPRLEERVWGGRRLHALGRALPGDVPIGESWEISDVEGKASIVSRGAHRGESLRTLVEEFPREVLGAGFTGGARAFPLLLKLLDAAQDLSVQVHPSRDDLRRIGVESNGKTESWIIVDAAPGARIIHGLAPGVSRASAYARLESLGGDALPESDVGRLFRWVEVKRGDVVHVPAGTIHTIGSGLLILEVQETCDITYRLHDWGRPGTDGRPRALHLREAAGVADPEAVPVPITNIDRVAAPGRFVPVLECSSYTIELLSLPARGSSVDASTDGGGFHILAPLVGRASYRSAAGDALDLGALDFALIPAALGRYSLSAGDAGSTILRVQAGV